MQTNNDTTQSNTEPTQQTQLNAVPAVPGPQPPTAAQAKLQQFNQAQLQKQGQQPTLPPLKKKAPTQPMSPNIAGNDLSAGPTTGETAADQLNNYFSTVRVATGLLAAFALLVGLIWLLMPTSSGFTRAQLLWFTFIGTTQLNTQSQTAIQSATVQQVQTPTQPQQPQTVQAQGPSQDQFNHATVNSAIDFAALDLL